MIGQITLLNAASRATADVRRIRRGDRLGENLIDPSWSPDVGWLACVRTIQRPQENNFDSGREFTFLNQSPLGSEPIDRWPTVVSYSVEGKDPRVILSASITNRRSYAQTSGNRRIASYSMARTARCAGNFLPAFCLTGFERCDSIPSAKEWKRCGFSG